MNTFSCWLVQMTTKWLRHLVALVFLFMVWMWSFSAYAAESIDPQLEQQILQIIREHPQVILESVQAYQQKQRQQIQLAQQTFVQQIKTNPQLVIGESPIKGSKDAKVLLVEFSDFQCPYCAQAHKTIKRFMVKHQDEVTLVYKHFPLAEIHPQAIPAATAAWAAQQQGKFWEYQDALFTHQQQLGEFFYVNTAKNLNLDMEKFMSDRLLAQTPIQNDRRLAENLGLSGTPFFVMNGETLSGAVDIKELEDLLNRVK
ncbi:MAG: thioredoxin domain-containing protein [Scytonema sp. PMC 1069.18]|nr:thioredoxin domain-containing protein [Scytonema sp. PMC 1069.18]MEC4887729.1 thioredoxin domain-containing protein [Scytonema sp. PMC 1070.18]